MNERHDALYNRARGVLNQNLKRLWFKVNPYLEKKDTLDAHMESPTRFIQPLQSTILSESLLDQDTLEHTELEIGGFWDFLYSDKWSDHCSVRVTEGQLLETMMAVLHQLENDGEVIHKNTHAYARNERERRGCYRLPNQKGCDMVQETLLLEFTFYGRRKPWSPKSAFDSSSCYPGNGSTTSSTWPFPSPSCPSSTEIHTNYTAESPKSQDKTKPKHRRRQIAPNIRKHVPKNTPRRPSLLPNTCGILEEDNATLHGPEVTNRNILSEVRDFQTTSAWNDQQSHISSESSDFRTTNSIVRNLSKLPCSERTAQAGNVMIEEVGLSGEKMAEDAMELWQETMYLSDLKSKHDVENVSTKLKRLMKEKHMAKKEMEAFYEEWKKRRISAFKPTSIYAEIDAKESTSGVQYLFLDDVPEFEDFLLTLEEESKFDPKFNRAKQISRKIAKRYNIAKENIADMTGIDTDHKTIHDVSSRLSTIAEEGDHLKVSFRYSDNKLRSSSKTRSGARRVTMTSRSSVTSIHGNEMVDNERTAHAVGVVTHSKSCEKHVLGSSGRRCKCSKSGESRKRGTTHEVMPTIYLTSPAGWKNILYQPHTSKVEKKRKGKVHVTNTSSPIAEVELEQEPPEKAVYGTDQNDTKLIYSSGEDIDDTMTCPNLFDSRKLNTKYSFERLRGKNYHKKKPDVFSALKKYFKMQKVADVFTDNKFKLKSVFQHLIDKDKTHADVPDTEVIGKLKTYNFLYHRRRTKTDVEECDFSSLSIDEFRTNLIRALDDFVVRKERVVSNIGAKSTTHITFTRQSIFNHRE